MYYIPYLIFFSIAVVAIQDFMLDGALSEKIHKYNTGGTPS